MPPLDSTKNQSFLSVRKNKEREQYFQRIMPFSENVQTISTSSLGSHSLLLSVSESSQQGDVKECDNTQQCDVKLSHGSQRDDVKRFDRCRQGDKKRSDNSQQGDVKGSNGSQQGDEKGSMAADKVT